MNRFELDWSYIRRSTLLPIFTAVVAVAMLVVGIWAQDRQQRMYLQFSVNQDAVHEDYDDLVHRRRLIDRYHRRYQQFQALGFVGEESRLEWIETLRATSTDLFLPRVSYAIQPQLQVVAPVQSIPTGDDAHVYLSRLELEIGLVHELDLLHFFDELQHNAPGLIKVDRCDLLWQADADTRLAAAANILASCSIQIFSVITSDVGDEATTS